jgi:hypothetical protein
MKLEAIQAEYRSIVDRAVSVQKLGMNLAKITFASEADKIRAEQLVAELFMIYDGDETDD